MSVRLLSDGALVDIAKQIEYWRESAVEDFEAARVLITSGRYRHGLFFAHLSIEKLLKACICKVTGDVAPRFHNLVRLAEIAKLELSDEILDILAEMNAYNLEGRYPVPFLPNITEQEAQRCMAKSEEVIQWLTQQS